MSTYPVAFDATFPGYPYVDNTQFVDQTQANSWVLAIQAIEAAIGYGTGGTPASPLYSATYATTYATITARIAALENTVSTGGVKVNTAAGNIQSVGASNQAGSTGLAADAGHVHAGQSASSLLNIGTIFMWPGLAATFPSNCLSCNGQMISTSTYATLFSIIGYTYGGSGGSFALPNFNDRFPIGVNSTAPAAGSTGGSTSITVNNMPAHGHFVNIFDPGHDHPSYIQEAGNFFQGIYLAPGSSLSIVLTTGSPPGAQQVSWSPGSPIDPGSQNHWASAGTGVTASTNNTGNGAAYTQPYLGIYFLIRAL